jgi:hypothetical protein
MCSSMFVTKVYAIQSSIVNPLPRIAYLSSLLTWITNAVIIVGLGLVLVFLALGFIKFITSQGDKVATEQAQKWVTYAVLGGVGLFAVYAIKAILLAVLGVKDPLKDY